MQKRIDYLTEKVNAANNAMKEAQAIGDYFKYPDAVKAYNVAASERTWLYGVQSLIKPQIERDSYEVSQYGDEIAIRLTFAGVHIPTPLNHAVYETLNGEVTYADSIYVEPLNYQFRYSLRFDPFPPAGSVAYPINQAWVRADKFLDGFVQSVRFANDCLTYIKEWGLKGTSIDWQFAVSMALGGGDTRPLRNLLSNDAFVKRISYAAKEYWDVSEKLVIFNIERNAFQIDWQPFAPAKDAQS